jgi:hypothetical protein
VGHSHLERAHRVRVDAQLNRTYSFFRALGAQAGGRWLTRKNAIIVRWDGVEYLLTDVEVLLYEIRRQVG